MKKCIILSMIALTLVGCSTLKTVQSDVQTGFTAPPQQGEVMPQTVGQNVSGVVASLPIPFSGTAAPLIGGLVTLFAAWQRGKSIRKNQSPSVNPVTGFLGDKAGLESVVQSVSTVTTGITEVFKEGSTAQHAWQGILTGLIGLFGTSLAIPQIATAVSSHPEIYAWVAGIAGLANAAQQALTQVKPVSPTPTT